MRATPPMTDEAAPCPKRGFLAPFKPPKGRPSHRLDLAIAAAAGDDTHLSRTLKAEEPHEEAQEPQIIKPHEETQEPHRHRPHSNSEPQGSQPPTRFGFSSIASWHLGLSELLSLSLFHEYRRMGFKHDYPSYSALVYKLARSRSFEAVEEILGRIEENDVRCRESLLVALIRHYGKVHLVDKAVGLFQRMTSFNCTRTLQSFNTILKVLVENDKLADTIELLQRSYKMGFWPNSVSFNVIMKGWLEKGEWEIACQVFDEMLEKRVQPTVVTYNSLVGFLCRKGDVERAMGLLEDMTHKGKYPNASTYALLMEGLLRDGNIDHACFVVEEMEKRKIRVKLQSWEVLATHACGADGGAGKLLTELSL
ncbi:hypothetical protein NL676_004559 [Syzygium grande]|nr:hypothetical protein NL676_004559 [Syzygium grande]